MTGFAVVPVSDVPPAQLVAALSESFGVARGEEWFAWKHLEGPWGPSRGWAALDDAGVVGVRLFLPWRVRQGGRPLEVARAVDGAVLPRARRRGVFSRLVRAETDRLAAGSDWTLLYSTSVPASREAYRRLGWNVLPAQHMVYGPAVTLGRPVAIDQDESCLAGAAPAAAPSRLATAWDERSLRWRLDPRSGHAYVVAAPRNATAPTAVVGRVLEGRRLRALSFVHGWGPAADQRRSLSALARRLRCPVVAAPRGAAVWSPFPVRGLNRPGASVSIWHTGSGTGAPVAAADPERSWGFTSADLEGVL